MKIAIPSATPGGLEAGISDHFGHCDIFTLINVADNKVTNVELLPNGGHEHGGCMTPVMLLKDNGVNALLAGGMGMRPLSGFQQVGIDVFFKEDAQTVQQALDLLLAGQARKFGEAQTCQGHSGGGGSEGGCGSH